MAMNARAGNQSGKLAPWKILVCIAIAISAAYQLYEWHETGRIYARKFGSEHYVSYAEHPVLFTCAAVICVSSFLLFSGGLLVMLINSIRRRRWDEPMALGRTTSEGSASRCFEL
jgi:hypothetical protein